MRGVRIATIQNRNLRGVRKNALRGVNVHEESHMIVAAPAPTMPATVWQRIFRDNNRNRT